MTLRDDLIAAKALIDAPEKWVKHSGDSETCFCSMTACFSVLAGDMPTWQHDRRFGAMRRALTASLPAERRQTDHPVVEFNDDPATTHADVMGLFDRAIAAATENNRRGSEMNEWAKNAAAFASLAITQRRLALHYRREAANASSADDAKFCRAEARRLWDAAKWNISQARDHRTLASRTH